MIALIQITPWHWAGFILCILFFLALDLGLFHRGSRVVKFKEAVAWSVLWFTLAMLFAGVLAHARGREEAAQFTAGYLIELSLSLDNILVIALIFSAFRVPAQFQHRVLFWGILGALVMRGAMIAGGVALIREFDWILYVFGVFLVFTGIKMLFAGEQTVNPETNIVLRLVRKLFPIAPQFEGKKFFTRINHRFALTPLALVLVLVETTDLIFAVDSVPAVFSITKNAFIVFTSNVFAILGLRSMYFLLAGALGHFRYLKIGLSIVLVFVGVKMLLDPHGHSGKWFQLEIPTNVSLMVVAAVVLIAIVLSTMVAEREKRTGRAAKKINHG
jgi:tellurite resistance protein TerC